VTVSTNSSGYTINATPSAWGVGFSGVATWPSHRDEVKSTSSRTVNDSQVNQLYCHLLGTPLGLPVYNLESWRPNVNPTVSLAKYKCNPGAGSY
jgi:hypothetical protein